MERRGERFWEKMAGELKMSGLSATAFCKEKVLKRGMFLRWGHQLDAEVKERGLVEVPKP